MNDRLAAIGLIVVSLIVLLLFSAISLLMFWKGSPNGAALDQLVGGIVQLAGLVVGYWVGSSVGSAQKTNLLRGKHED